MIIGNLRNTDDRDKKALYFFTELEAEEIERLNNHETI